MNTIALKMRSVMLHKVCRSKQSATTNNNKINNAINNSVMLILPSLGVGVGVGGNVLFKQYSTDNNKVTQVAEKARSTAEEFVRQAKEKKDETTETAKETFEESKEAVIGKTEQEKEKFKEKVERGDYDRIGRP